MSVKTNLKKSSKVAKDINNTNTPRHTNGNAGVDFNLDNIIDSLPQMDFTKENPSIQTGSSEKKVRKMPASILPPEEHAKILRNYTEISKASWLQIPVDTYVRYIDKNNMLHQGGKLKCFSKSVSSSSTLMELIKYNHVNRKRIVIKINVDNITSIWRLNDRVKKTTSKTTVGGQGGQGGQGKSIQVNQGIQGIQGIQGNQEQPVISNFDEQFEMESEITTSTQPLSHEDEILNKLGNKLLFEEGDVLKQKVENIESEVFRLNEEMKKMFILVKRLYRMLEKPLA